MPFCTVMHNNTTVFLLGGGGGGGGGIPQFPPSVSNTGTIVIVKGGADNQC